ncbi:MAG TPA: TIGR03619 family F420-dependent LLM class oxidoreductase [Candidatus Saccharimonadales bacterium]|nr:TIGR03619 family F420-dependent LLM class oxidoreductase [Candidatus Saccharimonadales bacterium]
MQYGIILPTMPVGANREAIEAAAETAERLGWRTAWTTDHLLVPRASIPEYGEIYEAIVTLTWVGARHASLRLGTSVIVVPMRNAVVLAKEIATLDALSGGRAIAGVGVGWNASEFANVGAGEVFHRRGAYVEESIRLWRHLWSGSTEPFKGQFFDISDFAFGPLPAQGAKLPILVGGSSEPAVRRAGAMADGYHGTGTSPAQFAQLIPIARRAAAEAGRPAPAFSGRVRVVFDGPPKSGYAVQGTPEQMIAELRAFEAEGVSELAFVFGATDPEAVANRMTRFDRDVLAALR